MSTSLEIPCCSPATSPPATVFDRMVTIRVGNGEEPNVDLQVYRGLLCHHSTTFKEVLSSKSEEPALIDISGEADTFRLFFRWLNTGSLVDYGLPSWQDIVDVYLFAKGFGVRTLQNHALDMFMRKHADNNEVPVNAANILYQELSPGDPFRRLLVYVVAERWGFDHPRDQEQELPSAFWHDLVDLLRGQGRAPGDLTVPRKDWIRQESKSFCDRFHFHTGAEKAAGACKYTEKDEDADDPSHCYQCGESGHFAMFCPFRRATTQPSCFNCAGTDHTARDCPQPKDWTRHRCSYCRKFGHARSRCAATTHIPKDGTAGTPFKAHVEKEAYPSGCYVQMAHFQAITCQPPYQGCSLEELRLADYQQKRRFSSKLSRRGL